MAIEAGWTDDEIGHIEGKETFAIETTRVTLRQHKGLADHALGIDMTEIGPCEETVVTTGTEYHPARIGAPVVKRFRIFRVSRSHGVAFSCREIEQVKVGLMVPDTELSVVGECVAKETTIVGRTREGYRLVLSHRIDYGFYLVAKMARCGIEIDAAEIIVDGVELMTVLREGLAVLISCFPQMLIFQPIASH